MERATGESGDWESQVDDDVVEAATGGYEDRFEKTPSGFHIDMSIQPENAEREPEFLLKFDPREKIVLYQSGPSIGGVSGAKTHRTRPEKSSPSLETISTGATRASKASEIAAAGVKRLATPPLKPVRRPVHNIKGKLIKYRNVQLRRTCGGAKSIKAASGVAKVLVRVSNVLDGAVIGADIADYVSKRK